MEELSRTLQPYKSLVGQAASYLTIAQFFSGGFLCRDIYKKGNTKGIAATPFVGGVVIGTLMLKYGLLLGDPAMLRVNISAIGLNILYSLFYYQYSTNKWEDILKPLSIGAGMIAIFYGYAELESAENLEFRYGLIVTVLMLLLLGAPLMDVKKILETKDASSIPFPITFMGAIVSFLWFFYGIILLNNFMVVQNLIGFLLCLVQLLLIRMYPANESSAGQKKEKRKVKKDN